MGKEYVSDSKVNSKINDNISIVKNPAISYDIFDSSLLSTCSIEHLSNCECQRDRVEKAYIKYIEEELNELKQKGYDKNEDLIEVRKEYAMEKALKETSKYCIEKKIKCSIEEAKIKKQLNFFASKYDLTDPRIYIIVEALINQMLSVHRMQQYSNINGIINIWYDKNDNKRTCINPVEEIKLKYDEARIQSIAILDKITEGEKININLQTIDIDDVFKNINMKIIPGKYREIID